MMLTAEQLEARKGKMTSSVVCAALGLHDKASPLDAYLAIRGEKPWIENAAIERGNKLEDVVLEHATTELDKRRGPSWLWDKAPFRAHPEYPWAADSCDAVYWQDGSSEIAYIGEGKTVAGTVADEYGEEDTDEVPRPTLIQAHWHLIHWPEVEECLVPVLVGGFRFEFRLYRIARDEEFHGKLLEEVARWHRDHIVAGKPPAATHLDTEHLRRMWPKAMPGKFIADAPEIEAAARAKVEADGRVKAAEQERDAAANTLRQILGDAEGVKAAWGSVTYKNERNQVGTDWQAVARAAAQRRALSDGDIMALAEKYTQREVIEHIDWMRVAIELGSTKKDEAEHTVIRKPGPRVLRVRLKKGEV